MSFYEAFKDAINIAQKADNVDLYRQLLDLSAQALDLQAEVLRLKEENAELKKTNEIEADIEYYVDALLPKKLTSSQLSIALHVGSIRKNWFLYKTGNSRIIYAPCAKPKLLT